MSARYLTKSRFKLAVDCPTKLYYTGKKEYANLNDGNEFLETLADGGFQVGELAKFMYPEGIEIRAKGTEQAIAETANYLTQENFTLFEPAIVFGNFLVRVDVLIKRGDSLQVIEVKAKSYSGDPASLSGKRKPIAGEYLPYVQDVAFQKYVVQQAFPHCSVSAHLLMPDKSKTAHVNGLNQWFKVQRNGRSIQVRAPIDSSAPWARSADRPRSIGASRPTSPGAGSPATGCMTCGTPSCPSAPTPGWPPTWRPGGRTRPAAPLRGSSTWCHRGSGRPRRCSGW